LQIAGAAVIVCGVFLARTGAARLKRLPQPSRPASQ